MSTLLHAVQASLLSLTTRVACTAPAACHPAGSFRKGVTPGHDCECGRCSTNVVHKRQLVTSSTSSQGVARSLTQCHVHKACVAGAFTYVLTAGLVRGPQAHYPHYVQQHMRMHSQAPFLNMLKQQSLYNCQCTMSTLLHKQSVKTLPVGAAHVTIRRTRVAD